MIQKLLESPQFIDLIVTIVVTLVGLLLGGISHLGVLLIKRTKSEVVRGIITRAQNAIERSVLAIEQAYVRDLRARNGLSAENAFTATEEAVLLAKRELTATGIKELSTALKIGADSRALDAWLTSSVKAAVAKMKVGNL